MYYGIDPITRTYTARIPHVLMWQFWCARSNDILVFIPLVAYRKHQNNTLVSARIVRHSRLYIIPYIFHTICTRFWLGLVIHQLLNWYHQVLHWYDLFKDLQRIILMTWKMLGYQYSKHTHIIIKMYNMVISTEFCWGQLKLWNMVHILYKQSVSLFGQWISMSEIKSLYAEVMVPRKHINASLATHGEQLSNLGYLLQAWPRIVLGITMVPATVTRRVARLLYPVSKQRLILSMPESNDFFV